MRENLFMGIQTFMAEAGEASCYADSIIKIASIVTGKYFPIVETLADCVDKNFIHYSEANPDDPDNFFVEAPDKMLSFLTGQNWTLTKESADYVAKPGEYVVNSWERAVTGATFRHFRLADWDSLMNSKTVKFGKIVSKRVFRKV